MHRRQQRSRHAHLREHLARSRHSRYGRGGPRARRGDIRAAILALLAERPMHGYEMIKELEQRTDGAWVPSAGSIYPTLQLLEEEGLIAGEEVEGKRRFTLTEAGTAAAAEREEAPPWEDVSSGSDSEVVRLKHSLVQLNHSIAQVFHAADDEQRKRVRELLDETRRQIYGVLAEES
jgi:DNA-binding PadR family transcriptional regulator